MDSVVGEDQTLPFDINGSCSISRLPDSLNSADVTMDNMTAPMFPGQKMSPTKAMTMKDYENQITALKKENFNLKLRIYFLEERVQQKCDDSTEEIYKTNIELKVEVESMKRDLAEKQELLVSASKALESLANRDSGEGLRERARREMDALREAFNARIRELEESLRCAEEEVEKMASIAEQEKLRSLGLEKELEAVGQSGPLRDAGSAPGQDHSLQQALQEKDRVIERLQESIKNQDALIGQLREKDQDQPIAEQMVQLNTLIGQKDAEVQALKEELDREREKAEKENKVCVVKQDELNMLQQRTRQLTEELNSTKSSSQTLKHRLEELDRENKTLSRQLEEKESELAAEKKNALKRDKTIQGLSILLKEKERQVDELYGNLEEKDQALTKAREALHKAQLQKYQGGEEQQALLQSQHAELSRLQAECHSSLLELQRLQRALSSKDAQLELLQQDKLQLENELELLQQHKRKGDKTINDLQNQLKKLSGELAERENLLDHQRLAQQEQTRTTEHKLQSTIQHLTTSLTKKEQQLQDYMSMVQDLEQDRASAGSDVMLAKLREKLREKEKALEKALDEKFVAVEEKENEIHLLQLNMREKERDLERLNNLLSHNEETVNSFDALLKEKDMELQQLLNSLKNLQRSKQESEENLQRALREKDSIIQQLQHTLQLKTKDMEDMASTVISHSESQGRDLAEQMGQRLKVTETMLAEAVKHRERLVCENQTAVENLLATISSKDQLLKESAERHTQALSVRTAELQDLRRQLADTQLQLSNAQNLSAALNEKDALINKLLDHAQERDHCLSETKVGEAPPPQVVELTHTIKILQQRLEEKEIELSQRYSEENMEKSLTVNKKPAVILKKELAQKTDALNSALKRENQLKMALSELRSTVSELEGRLEGQTANVESLKSTISTKDEIITELQQHLAQMGVRQSTTTPDHHSQYGEELSFRSLPQREKTIIGGDRQQQQEMSSLGDLCSEQAELNHILREEQQIYTKLVHVVKEQDSAQRLQALQLELAAVALLRQQLEDGVRNNNELREQLRREIERVNQREGVDPAELENMRDALEEAQRWNASLQARLGEIQSRGGGVGQANDMDDTLSLIGEQTSYMSICVGEGQEEELQKLSMEQLRLKVSELQAVNVELQKRLALAERDIMGNAQRESQGQLDLIGVSPPSKQPQGLARPLAVHANERLTAPSVKETVDESLEAQRRMASSPLPLPVKDNANSPFATGHQGENERAELASLLRDCGAESVSQLREQVNKLRSEMSKLGVLLKEENSAESKESAESSGENDSHANLHRTMQTLRSEARSHRKVVRLLKEQLQRNAKAKAEGGPGFDPELIDSMARKMERLKEEHEATQKHAASLEDRLKEIQNRERNEGREREEEKERKKKGRQDQSKKLNKSLKHAYAKSRLPVAVRPAKQRDRQELTDHDTEEGTEQLSTTDSEKISLRNRGLSGAELQSSPGSSFEALWDSESRRNTHPEPKQNCDASQNSKNVSDFPQSELLSQLELLNQECQEKEELISQLQFQMQNWEELQAELQEKDRLNGQYLEALHAAESTIAYLTACNLDSESSLGQPGLGSVSSLQWQCTELQRVVQEKDKLNAQLLECLNTAEAAIASLTSDDQPESFFSGQNDPQALCERLEGLLSQIKSLQEQKNASTGTPKELNCPDGGSASDLQRQAETLQESLLQQCRLNAELQEKLRTAEETITKLCAQNNNTTKGQGLICSHKCTSPQEEMVHEYEEGQHRLAACLSECILAAEQAVGSLTDYGSRSDQLLHGPEILTDTELEQNLDRLQKALLERDRFEHPGSADISHSTIVGPLQHKPVQHILQISGAAEQKTSTPISQGQQKQVQQNISEAWDPDQSGSPHLNLHKNLTLLVQIFKQHAQKVWEMGEALKVEQGQGLKGGDGLKPKDVAQLESLQKALKEKQKMCQKLEEKLATAQSIIALQKSSKRDKHSERRRAPRGEQDDKGIQVDAQDLGYETSGRSETEVEREEGSSTDVDGAVCLDPALSGFTSADNLDTTASSPSYPSSPDLSSPRPHDPKSATKSDSTHELLQLRSQVESQHKVIAHLQRLLPKKNVTVEVLSVTSDPASCEEEEESAAMKARISQLTTELERERMINRSNESASPSRMESLVQSQARELCELREQIRVSRALGAEQRRQLLELRGALEELIQPNDGQSALGTTLQKHLDLSLSLLDKLEQADPRVENDELPGLELAQRFTAELQEKEKLIQQLKDQLHGKVPSMHQDLESEMSDRISNDSTVSVHDSLHDLHTLTEREATEGMRATSGKSVPDAEPHPSSQGDDGSVYTVQRDNGRLQEQLRKSEELNATLRSELNLTHSILTRTQSQNTALTKRLHTQSSSSVKHTHSQSQATDSQQAESVHTSISSDLLMEHLQEVRALRQRLEETIRTNERLREQLERKLQQAERDPDTHIFIAGSEDASKLNSDIHYLWAQNHTLKEQLNQAARDKQKENDCLRETLSRRTAKLELSRKECETLREECTHLQNSLYRLQCEQNLQKQQLADTQQLLQSVQVELQVHEQIRNSIHTHTEEERVSSESSEVDLRELLSEVRSLRLQLERSIQTNTALRHKLEQQLLTQTDPPSTININYLLPQADEGGKSEMLRPHSHTDHSSTAYDSGSSVQGGSPALSRLVPGHRLWADRHGRHVLGLLEDYTALSKQIREAKRITAAMDKQLQDRFVECAGFSGSVSTMQQVLEEAGRLLKLLWRVSLPTGDLTHSQQNEVLRSEIAQLKSRLSQQERMLTGAVKRLRSTNQLKEGMERIIIEQLSLTHGVLKKARGNLESKYFSVFGIKDLQMEGNPTECPVTSQQADVPP
ncbi:CDK5 regulatory subunit-associated protein 2 isoform X4 [Pangasianodon hypophthalmus]|uniref:CDK5 regulatory subunit-associated protein 2 isoform X4 n=1 Tax=Pangasianodon hypophthalmus TaxID=310915 RepID=UPI002308260D|nr:CDK5 regulatory subunit-associated protein 2 isoform X4 [Pangasianodon hypophthalmus]